MIALFVLGVLFVVFLIWIILSIILYKFINIKLIENNKKKLPKYIGFPLSAFIVVFITSCFTSGWGWFVPYSFQPSYWQFRSICKLNELPNNEEKYNKILGYFDLSLDSLDYDKFQETSTLNFQQQNPPFKKFKIANDQYLFLGLATLYEYHTNISNRISLSVSIIFNNDKPKNKQDIESISMNPQWQTYRIDSIYWNIGTSGDFGMPTKILDCDDLKER